MKDNEGVWLIIVLMCMVALATLAIYHDDPAPKPQPPACRVCHCGKVQCHKECSEENMCAMRCADLCKKFTSE